MNRQSLFRQVPKLTIKYNETTLIRLYGVTDLKSEDNFDTRGHLVAALATEVMKSHMEIRESEITELNSEV